MSISKIKTGSITADAVSTSKIATDAITEAKVADGAIENEHINSNVITGHTELAEAAAGTDILLVYDASAGTLKKIQASNVGLQAPSVSSVSPTSVLSGDGTGNYTFTITGSGYVASAVPTLITNGGASVSFDSFTIDSSTQITGVIAKSNLGTSGEPYDVKVTIAGALSATLENQINVDQSPVFNTASGSVGSFSEQTTISTIDIEAYDPDSAGNVTFELQSGSLPAGLSATTVHENGVSKYRITGTLTTDQSSLVTTNFTLRAVDAASNTSSRAFSISEAPSGVESFTSSGTFSVPTGITTVNVLVVAGGAAGGTHHGGGGGAGGLIFIPDYSVTPGGTISVTVGCGGGQPNNYPAPDNPGGQQGAAGQDSVFGTLTAKGGGGGASAVSNPRVGLPGGSGGGGAGPGSGTPYGGGTATQPTQPGQSGAYGFGNPGGADGGNCYASGGGGGSGATGSSGGPTGGPGGAGKAYTIADGTTPVYYAGGGGGAYFQSGCAGSGGQGGGGNGGSENEDNFPARQGGANKGGGGGGSDRGPGPTGAGGAGGKGIVIVSY